MENQILQRRRAGSEGESDALGVQADACLEKRLNEIVRDGDDVSPLDADRHSLRWGRYDHRILGTPSGAIDSENETARAIRSPTTTID